MADAEYTLVTLRYERAATELQAATSTGLLDPILRRISPGGDEELATAQYWKGDYQALTGSDRSARFCCSRRTGNIAHCERPADPGSRSSAGSTRSPSATRMSSAPSTNEEAAYNYEFVLRRRSAILSKQPLPAVTPRSST